MEDTSIIRYYLKYALSYSRRKSKCKRYIEASVVGSNPGPSTARLLGKWWRILTSAQTSVLRNQR